MPSNNYFRVANEVHAFDDESLEETATAWAAAKSFAEEWRHIRKRETGVLRSALSLISCYRKPRTSGPWSGVNVVGETRQDIVVDDSHPSFDVTTGRPHPFSGE